jgi:hypothetical protein
MRMAAVHRPSDGGDPRFATPRPILGQFDCSALSDGSSSKQKPPSHVWALVGGFGEQQELRVWPNITHLLAAMSSA